MAMIIDFYILNAATYQQSLFFACQLLEKIYHEQQSAYVYLNSHEEAERFDNLLWTYRDNSFLPHYIHQTNDPSPPPIQIGYAGISVLLQGILINLAENIPPFYPQFDRIIEIVFSEPQMQQLARERYKQYRDQGYEINVHQSNTP